MLTYLFADVETSTARWGQAPEHTPEAVPRVLALFEHIVRLHDGSVSVESGEGDGRVAAFDRAKAAPVAAVEFQRLVTVDAHADGPNLRVGMAVHAEDASLRDATTHARPGVHRAARLRSLARGGQIVVSRAVRDIVADDLPDDVELLDVGTHPVRDLSQPERVFVVRHPDLLVVGDDLGSVAPVRHNLPAQLSSFVGREAELIDISDLLTHHRLVTLTGPGGCGKTRLALEAAADAATSRRNGAWLVQLAPLPEARLVPSALLEALGIGHAPGQDIQDRLVDYLRDWHALLLFDTCEHVIDEVASLVHQLLSTCAQLSILTTSREPLGVTGEQTWRVPPLGIGGDEEGEGDALRLFIERARSARPSFSLDDARRGVAREICRRLDGMPLAIELGAARVRTLSVEQILRGLDDRFRLLSGGGRTALPRQRTLQASVEWSFDLLDDDERAVFRRLAVFAAGFDLATAEEVVAFDGIDSIIVYEVLSRLVDKSLVQAEDDGRGVMRYSLLDTMRQFASDRLIEAGESESVRDRHLAQIRSMAEQAEQGIGRSDPVILEQLNARIDDIRMALDWSSVRAEGGDDILAIVGALGVWWSLWGRPGEGHELCQRALHVAGPDADAAAVRRVQWVLAHSSWHAGDPVTSLAEAQAAAAAAAAAGDTTIEARALSLASSAVALVDPPAARDMLVHVTELAEAGGDAWTIADVARNRALAALWQDDWEAVELALRQAESLAAQTDPSVAFITACRAYTALMRGEFEDAVTAADRARHVGIDDSTAIALSTTFLILGLVELGRLDDADAALQESEFLLHRHPGALGAEQLAFVRGVLALWRRDFAGAISIFEPLRNVLLTYGVAVLLEQVTLYLAVAYEHRDDVGPAESLAEDALALGRRTGSRRQQAAALLTRSRLALRSGAAKTAEDLAHEALTAASEIGSRQWVSAGLEQLGAAASAVESFTEATRLLAAATPCDVRSACSGARSMSTSGRSWKRPDRNSATTSSCGPGPKGKR